MTAIPLARSDFYRQVTRAGRLLLKNRYYEENPTLNDRPVGLIARPRLKRLLNEGDGPIRGLNAFPGAFDGDAFFISGTSLYRLDRATGVPASLGVISTGVTNSVEMTATAALDDIPQHLFIAEGGVLWCYAENGYALGHLSASGNLADGDQLVIGGVYYTWTSGSVDASSPAGTAANPWRVKWAAASNAANIGRMFDAINDTGLAGTDYSTALTAHTTVASVSWSTNDLYVRARTAGTGGNAIATTETSAVAAWAAATLEGGGSESLFQVDLPGDVGAISVDHINGYVIVIPVQGADVNGRFYWIEPGDVFIDPLNYATAERSPDAVNQVKVFSNLFWLLGENTTEPWQITGDPDAPVRRFEGVLYDRGAWRGTAVKVRDALIMADEGGRIVRISGGEEVISTPDIEERVRRAIQASGGA